MAVRGVDDDQINAGVNQGLAAFKAGVTNCSGSGDPETTQFILAGMRVQHGFFGVFQRQKPGKLAFSVGYQKFFDPPRFHQADRLIAVDRFAQDRQICARHHHLDRGFVVAGKAHVAVGDDAKHATLIVHNREAGDIIALHQDLSIGERLIGGQGDRVVDHAAFEAFDAANLFRLGFGVEIAVDHTDAAGLRHGDGHPRFRDGVHRRG